MTARNGMPGRRQVMAGAAGLAATTLVAACSGSDNTSKSGTPPELRIAYQRIPNGALIVKHNRWLEKALGIPIRWIRYDSGAAVNKAVADHDIDVGLAGTSSIAVGVPAGLTYKVAWIFDVIGDAESLVVHQGGGIHSLHDLPGKRVAVPFGSTTHYALLAALERKNVDSKKVDIVDLQPDQIVRAWDSGRIDAAYTWQPSLNKIMAKDGRVLLTSAQLAREGIITADLGIVSEEFADDFPDVVTTWLTQEDRAVRLYQKDPSAAAKAVAAELNISPARALQEMKGYAFVNAKQQLTPRYLGTDKTTGNVTKQITDAAVFLHDYPRTAKFLKEYKLYQPVPTLGEFEKVVDPNMLKRVVK